jgi:hypothetical protein
MTDAISALAAAGAAAIISAMATDLWGSFRDRLAKVIGRAGRRGEEPLNDHAAVLFDRARETIMRAPEQDRSQVAAGQHTVIAHLLTGAMADDPVIVDRIRALLTEFGTTTAPHPANGDQNATASDSAQQAAQYSGTQHNTFSQGS